MRTLRLGAEYAVQHVAPDCLNREGIARNAESQWSNHFTLRAMALLEGVDIVSINEGAMNSNELSDRANGKANYMRRILATDAPT